MSDGISQSQAGQSISEPVVITYLRNRLHDCEKEGRIESRPAATVVGDSWGSLGGVRPHLLSVNDAGERVYSLTVRQVRKLLASWDAQ